MKKMLLILGLFGFLAFPSLAIAGQECPICGMDAEKSPIMAVVTIGGKDIPCCSISHAYIVAFVKREGAKPDDLNNQVIPVKVKDYKSAKMFNFYDGYYLIEHTLDVKGAGKPPYVIGFSTREGAWKFWEENVQKIGGRIVNFETATREYRKYATGPSAKSKKKEAAAVRHVDHLLKLRAQKKK